MIKLFIYRSGNKYWYLDQVYHRANGPAVIERNGYQEWWWYGQEVDEYEHMMLAGQEQLNG